MIEKRSGRVVVALTYQTRFYVDLLMFSGQITDLNDGSLLIFDLSFENIVNSNCLLCIK